MTKKLLTIFLVITFLWISCKPISTQPNETLTHSEGFLHIDSTVYQSDRLIIQQLSPHLYQHISFLQTQTFGRVDCNGMIVVNEKEAIVFDTPANDESATELIAFITTQLNSTVTAVIPTHFHEDCVAAWETFQAHNIPGYATHNTVQLLLSKGRTFSKPLTTFEDSLALPIGDKTVYAQYFGEGHTTDNIIGYFPADNAMFGGCLIKSMGATKGNLEDANVDAWSATVKKIKQKFPETRIVIPGHGKPGTDELLEYTIKLFED
jgi:metallo-beta-lactamase class B